MPSSPTLRSARLTRTSIFSSSLATLGPRLPSLRLRPNTPAFRRSPVAPEAGISVAGMDSKGACWAGAATCSVETVECGGGAACPSLERLGFEDLRDSDL